MKLAFVTPWFGRDIPGGAEAECRNTAMQLARYGIPVEILTTCAKDFHSDWSRNHHREGTEIIDGLPVRRFAARKRNVKLYEHYNARMMSGRPLSEREAELFLAESIRSDRLVEYLRDHRNDYYYVFIPYLYGTTAYGAMVCPERSILIPNLHNEPYAHLKPIQEMFQAVRGVIFHSAAEMRLGMNLYGLKPEKTALLGEGIDTQIKADAGRFFQKNGIKDFLLYAGRKDEQKNVPLLISYFTKFVQTHRTDLKLVLIGSGKVEIPEKMRKQILDLGYLSDHDMVDAYAAAMALCQPSIYESFSLPLMESWLAGRPVLVNAECAVSREHCEASGGGLSFTEYQDFEDALEYLLEDPDSRRKMAERGKRYVLENYTWNKVVQRYVRTLSRWGIEF